MSRTVLNKVLICALTPYFLERENLWFEKNFKKILEARKIQSFWQDNTLFLQKNEVFNLSYLLRRLDEMGYEKVLKAEAPGEFAHRGNILDVFPINLNHGIRFEFWGNNIDIIEKLPVEIKDEKFHKGILKKKLKSQKIFSDLKHLKNGDYLVHLDHGVGVYNRKIIIGTQKYYQLEYAKGDKLYVPLGLERKLSKYIGFSEPKISRLGSLFWQKTKRRIKREAEKLAKELLEIYAKREIVKRQPYLPVSEIDLQLKTTFPFEETPDQVKVIEEIERDLKKEKPMDRLVCGDVGFGKTEIALRAMIRAVNSGHRTAMICPTTILANQHFQNFKKRIRGLPINIALLCRLQPKRLQKQVIANLKQGKVDIIIGTHRLLSKDVAPFLFKKEGGLLVIDDEHKFGVKQKEEFKKIRESIDVLSLSATPIPRSLYLTLCSLRDVSIIQTPPLGRLPIKTFILPFSEKTIKEAIEKEIKRGGQVYYLHNRIETIRMIRNFLENLTKKIKIASVHGRMKEKEIIQAMDDFKKEKVNVLVATTIIEAGIDFPNVNTLIVADATRLGLAQIYQIRGRVGRSHRKAFAFFFYSSKSLKGKAEQRLKALKQANFLGAGYQIALKDLEIRGAGNILGKEQSGNMNQVGLNLYCQMVSHAIEKMKK